MHANLISTNIKEAFLHEYVIILKAIHEKCFLGTTSIVMYVVDLNVSINYAVIHVEKSLLEVFVSSRYSGYSEAFASEFLEYLEDIYYI